MFTAGCVGVYSGHHVDVFAGVSRQANPWTDDADLNRHGGILVWDIDEMGEKPPVDWVARFENARVMESFECPAGGLAADRNARVGMIFIPPAGASTRTARSPGDEPPNTKKIMLNEQSSVEKGELVIVGQFLEADSAELNELMEMPIDDATPTIFVVSRGPGAALMASSSQSIRIKENILAMQATGKLQDVYVGESR